MPLSDSTKTVVQQIVDLFANLIEGADSQWGGAASAIIRAQGPELTAELLEELGLTERVEVEAEKIAGQVSFRDPGDD